MVLCFDVIFAESGLCRGLYYAAYYMVYYVIYHVVYHVVSITWFVMWLITWFITWFITWCLLRGFLRGVYCTWWIIVGFINLRERRAGGQVWSGGSHLSFCTCGRLRVLMLPLRHARSVASQFLSPCSSTLVLTQPLRRPRRLHCPSCLHCRLHSAACPAPPAALPPALPRLLRLNCSACPDCTACFAHSLLRSLTHCQTRFLQRADSLTHSLEVAVPQDPVGLNEPELRRGRPQRGRRLALTPARALSRPLALPLQLAQLAASRPGPAPGPAPGARPGSVSRAVA